ncbi:hypothetical protein [Catenovulum agarivorans]|uniref:hypothetical protein n=1 Tax=Catenovulum agarivorans TaxID=1172192 RepID=UPI00030C6AA6|nr:hypothetical protein [Catenovulum agarivorans]
MVYNKRIKGGRKKLGCVRASLIIAKLYCATYAGVMFESNMDDELKKKIDVVVGLSRLAGGTLIIIGSILVFFFIQATLDPNATIEVNGVPTKDLNAKIGAVIFCILFPICGALLAFTPSKFMDKWAAKIIKHLS